MGTSRRPRGRRTGRLVAVAAALVATLTLLAAPVGAAGPEPAAVQPDAIIQNPDGTGTIGNGVYNTDGTNQTKTRTVAAGGTFVSRFIMQNDSTAVQFLTPTGCAGNAHFKVKYFYRQDDDPLTRDIDVTSTITSGGLSVGRGPGQTETYRVVIKVKGTAPAGAVLRCRLSVRINVKGPDDPLDVAKLVIRRA